MQAKGTACITALAVLSGIAGAQSPEPEAARLDISGSVRLRHEAISGQLRTGFDEDDALTSLRTRVLARYGTRDVYVEGEMFDSRVFGAGPGTPVTTGEVNAAEVVQASLNIRTEISPGLPLKLQGGRFMVNLGSRRLVAADDYRNTTNGYTGIRADFGDPKAAVLTALYVLPQRRLPEDRASLDDADIVLDREGAETVLWGAIASVPAGLPDARLEATVIGFEERDTSEAATRDRSLETFGLRYFREPAPDKFDFDIEGFWQTGEVSVSAQPGAPHQDVGAGYLHLEAGRQWSGGLQPRLSLEFDYAGGDKLGGKFTRFDTLYGMRRAELAPAGLFNAVGRANIASPGLRLEVSRAKKFDAQLAARGLWLATAADSFSTTGLRDPLGESGKFAGYQLDTRLRWWLLPDKVRAEFNSVVVAHGEYLKATRAAPGRDFTAYAGIDLTFLF